MLNVRYWCCVVCGRRLAENVLLADAGHAEASCWGCGVVNVLPLTPPSNEVARPTLPNAADPALLVDVRDGSEDLSGSYLIPPALADARGKLAKGRASVVKG